MAVHPPHLPSREPESPRLSWRMRVLLLTLLVVIVLCVGVGAGWLWRNRSVNVQIIERATPVFVPQDAATVVARMDRGILRSVIPVMNSKATGAIKGVTSTVYIARDRVGYAVALTSDGWIVTTKDVLKSSDVVFLVDGRAVTLEKMVPDAATSLVFAKLKNAVLSPMTLGRGDTKTLSDVSAVPTSYGILRATMIDGLSLIATDALTHDAKMYSEYGLASPAIEGVEAGHPIISSQGELLGVVTMKDATARAMRFIPSSLIAPVLPELFASGKIVRPQLPVTYVELSQATILDDAALTQGARILTVTAKSGRETFPLREGDIVTAVGGVAVSSAQSFANLVFSSRAGAIVPMQVVRAGKDIVVDVTMTTTP
ncbi:MAG: S1C family serine protease [Patescibacteria group bacterium]